MPGPLPLPPTPSERIPVAPQPVDTPRPRNRFLSWAIFFCVTVLLTYVTIYWTNHLTRAGERSEAVSQCQQTLDAQVASWNAHDLEGFMAGYWNSEELTFCSGGTITKGWQATINRYRKRYQAEGKEMGHLTFADIQFLEVSPEFVIVRGHWHLEMKDSAPEGLFTLVMKPFADGWKVVYDHTSAADPPKKP